ncbi:MAG TPA: hypothetical protein VKC35_17565 [Vicinamibacterales bacterium]|nr:hypothetical protein [Vicinamibacterales bacterium]
MTRVLAFVACVVLIQAAVLAQQARHPDLSGVWSYAIDRAPAALKKEVNGQVTIQKIDQSARHGDASTVKGVLPSAPRPAYKPEFQAKVKDLEAHETRTDPVFSCGKPGVPRIGPPRKIVQLAKETIFLYEDISGDPYRVIPTDGRPHRQYPNPSAYGDSIGKWEGDVFVVDVTGFGDDTWFGEDGYFHTDAMHVVERIWRDGDNVVWQATVEEPKVLARPWVMPARLLRPSTDSVEESPRCVESDAPRLLNDDHHLQR